MQTINKSAVKKTFTHTWYLYPIAIIIVSLLWLWGFQAFHQPSAHQMLTIFFASNVRDSSFADKILDHYDREDLREIRVTYNLPSMMGFGDKLQVAINNADILVLDEVTLSSFNEHHQNFFVDINQEVKTKYMSPSYSYYSYAEKDYGILINNKEYLEQYMEFEEGRSYYLTLSVASKNLGNLYEPDNEHYDNALTAIKYLLTESR